MKKLKLFITTMLVLLFGGLSLGTSAQDTIILNGKNNAEKSLKIIDIMKAYPLKSFKSYSMSIAADTTYVGSTQVQISFKSTVYGATFVNANDSVSIFFEILENGLPAGSYYVHFTHGAGDSIIVASITLMVTPGAYYEITPHNILYQSGNPVCFADGTVLAFTTDCGASTISITSNPIGSVCAGTDVTLTASGATSCAWSTGENTASIVVTPSVTTIYTVTGTTGGCTASASKTVTVSGTFTPAVTPLDTAICSGSGSITITASGGMTYLWSTGQTTASITVSPTTTKTYTVTITNGSCSASLQVTVTVAQAMSVNATADPTAGCAGDPFNLTASSPTATSYLWNNGATTATTTVYPTVTTMYTVTVSNGTCFKTDNVTVTVEALPVVSYVVNGVPLEIHGTGMAGVDEMIVYNTTYPLGHSVLPTFHVLDSVVKFMGFSLQCSDYIILQTSNGCEGDFTYSCAGIEEEKGEDAICIKQNEQINLFDITGRLIQKINSPKDFTKKEIYLVKDLFINDLPPRCYFWNSTETTQKFMQ